MACVKRRAFRVALILVLVATFLSFTARGAMLVHEGHIHRKRRVPRTCPNHFFDQKYNCESEVGFMDTFRMNHEDFDDLYRALCIDENAREWFLWRKRPSACVITDREFLAATLWQRAQGGTDRTVEDVFGISHGYFNFGKKKVLAAIICLLSSQDSTRICFPSSRKHVLREIAKWQSGRTECDERYRFLGNCISTGDGTLSPVIFRYGFIPARWRCRKGYTAQNIMCFFSHDLKLQRLFSGGEGCSFDGTVLKWTSILQKIPGQTLKN